MAQLNVTSVKTALADIKARLVEIFNTLPGSGNVLPRIRYANDTADWLKIAAVERVAGVQVVRCVFVYLAGWASSKVEGRNHLLQPVWGVEIIQGFEDGTDEDNSTLRYEAYLADVIEHFIRDEFLGFTEGTEVTHTGLQGDEGDGRPVNVDGVLCHRKLATIQTSFKYC